MAMRCRTALVDPPVIMTIDIAFSKDVLVMMSSGLRSISRSILMYFPASTHSFCFSSESAGAEDENGSDNNCFN